MTDTEITALAREYAEEIYPHEEGEDIGQMNFLRDNAIRHISSTLKMLLRRYCLVEKEAINNTYQQAIEQGKHAHVRCQVESRAKLRLLESLFPEIAKEVEG